MEKGSSIFLSRSDGGSCSYRKNRKKKHNLNLHFGCKFSLQSAHFSCRNYLPLFQILSQPRPRSSRMSSSLMRIFLAKIKSQSLGPNFLCTLQILSCRERWDTLSWGWIASQSQPPSFRSSALCNPGLYAQWLQLFPTKIISEKSWKILDTNSKLHSMEDYRTN